MDQELRQDLLACLDMRGAFYRFLASTYLKELTEEQIAAVRDMTVPEENSLSVGYSLMKDYIVHCPPELDVRQNLAVDYASTFLGAGHYEKLIAPPYESVFLSPAHILMQEPRDEVVRAYAAEGVRIDPADDTPEDHMGFELQFMAELLDRQAAALESENLDEARRLGGVSQDFLQDHLAKWTPLLCNAIDEHARTDFYKGVSSITRNFIQDEVELLPKILEALDEASEK